MSIGIFGVGELARVAYEYCRFNYVNVDFLTSDGSYLEEPYWGESKLELVVFNQESMLSATRGFFGDKEIFFPIGYRNMNSIREDKITQALRWGIKAFTLVDRSVRVWPDNEIGEGSWILNGTNLDPGAKLGYGVICWSNSHIGHGARLNDFVWVTTNATICGQVEIGKNSFIGPNAVVYPHVKVGKRCFIGAGSVISEDTEDDSVYVYGYNNKIKKQSWELNM